MNKIKDDLMYRDIKDSDNIYYAIIDKDGLVFRIANTEKLAQQIIYIVSDIGGHKIKKCKVIFD